MMTGYGVRGALLVASRQFKLLTITNLVAALIGLGVVTSSPIEEALARRRHRKRLMQSAAMQTTTADFSADDPDCDTALAPPLPVVSSRGDDGAGSTPAGRDEPSSGETSATAALAGLVYPDRWPTYATLVALANTPRRVEWVDAIRRAKEFRFQCEMCPKGLEPVRALEAFMRHVRAIWSEAKAEHSALEPALGSALERLALVHARMAYRVKNEGGGLTSALEEALLDPTVAAGMRRRMTAQVRELRFRGWIFWW